MTDVYSVSGVTAYIRDLMLSDPPLQDIWISGEVSNMKAAASGHWYFTLKDERAQLKCVMFKGSGVRRFPEPKDGESVRVHGRINVYEARGEYQLYADEVQPEGGIGDLYLRFEQLKNQLQTEGLFDAERKRPVPFFPLRIGVVTSPDAAAFRDILNVLGRRFPLAEVILSPTLVQGAEAPPLIVYAIELLNRYQAADVILLCRGGGSIEDLWSFNDERVARAVADSQIPVISGVGHETDFTIVDFVADLRAPTPSAAAELATPSLDEFALALTRLNSQLDSALLNHLADVQDDLANARKTLARLSPERTITQARQRVDDRVDRIEAAFANRLNLWRERLSAKQSALETSNPQNLLQRGYAIVSRSQDGHIIQSEADAPVGTGITIRLASGELKARIEDKDSHERYKRTLF